MKESLMNFLVNYNLYRRHGSLISALKLKTPFDAVLKWHELDPTIFKEKPEYFKQKTLNLKCKQNKVIRNNLVKINTFSP
jgi:hypothetical protein